MVVLFPILFYCELRGMWTEFICQWYLRTLNDVSEEEMHDEIRNISTIVTEYLYSKASFRYTIMINK